MSTAPNPQVDAGHYERAGYDTLERWTSYWFQLNSVLDFDPEDCLEVGVGNGTVEALLRHHRVSTTTVDFDPALKPHRVGDVRSLPCADGEFDVVLCSEVLEHLPFEDVPRAIAELRRVCRRAAVISVPQFGRQLYLGFRLPPFPRRHFAIRIPSRHPFHFTGEHYWELGARNARLGQFVAMLERHFAVERHFAPPQNAYHRFFVLRAR